MSTHQDSLVGRTIDDFIITERVGRGGMSVVYSAEQPSMRREVALKIIDLQTLEHDHPEARQRFEQETALIAKLEHIHILPVYDYGIVGDELIYLAMRLLRGGSLSDLLKDQAFSIDRATDLFIQVGSAIAYAHAHNVIHRDIKPSNILLDSSGNAYVTDFGLAKIVTDSVDITRSGNIVGTPAYMAPEQLRGGDIDHRADIYSLGIVLYHMMTGKPPFESSESNVVSLIYKQLEESPQPPHELNPEITPAIEDVIMTALEKDPDKRFESVALMVDALRQATGRSSTGTFTAATPSKIVNYASTRRRAAQQRRALLLRVGISLLALVTVAVIAVLATSNRAPLPTATVLEDEVGTAADAIPDEDEIQIAQARLGADGFVAFVACNQSSEYHATQAREIGDMLAEYAIDYRVYDPDSATDRQIPLIEKARTDGASLLIICPLDIDVLDNALTAAQNAGLPLVLLHSDIPNYGGVILSGDEYLMGRSAGELAGQLIADERDGQADVIILEYQQVPAIITRVNGIEDGLLEHAPDANIIGYYEGAIRENALRSVGELLATGTIPDVIVSINDAGSFGAIDALEAVGAEPDEVIISSIDAETLAREYIKDGYFIRGSVDVGREKFSRAAADVTVRLLGGATVPEQLLVPPGDVITAETLAAESP